MSVILSQMNKAELIWSFILPQAMDHERKAREVWTEVMSNNY